MQTTENIAGDWSPAQHAALPECEECGYIVSECPCGKCSYCDAEIGDFKPSARDEKIVPHGRECEECYASLVRSERNDEYSGGLSRSAKAYYASGENWRGE